MAAGNCGHARLAEQPASRQRGVDARRESQKNDDDLLQRMIVPSHDPVMHVSSTRQTIGTTVALERKASWKHRSGKGLVSLLRGLSKTLFEISMYCSVSGIGLYVPLCTFDRACVMLMLTFFGGRLPFLEQPCCHLGDLADFWYYVAENV